MESRASTGCPNCQAILRTVSIERDDFGVYAALEVKRCADLTCGTLLCPACDQFQCDACGETFCPDHLVSVPDGTDRPLRLCAECDAESKPLCPACGEHADLRPMENATERWYECCRCHARMDEAEIEAAQPPGPAPTCMECYELMMTAATVGGMISLIQAHRSAGCPHCVPKVPDLLPAQAATLSPTAHAA